MSTVSTDSVADDQLRDGYDRWLRLEEEKEAIGADLKELFAELKANGFAPKALRESFRRVRNIADADQQEHDAVVDLYVASLTGARPARTREGHSADAGKVVDAETGEIIEPQAAMPAQAGGTETLADQSTAPGTDRGDNSTDGGSPAEPIDPAAAKTPPAGTQAPPVDTHPLSSAALPRQTEDRSVEAALHGSAPVTHSEPVTAPSPAAVTVVAGRESAMDPLAFPAVRLDRSKPHPDCQDPSDCGLASWTHMCGGCMRARAASASGVALQ